MGRTIVFTGATSGFGRYAACFFANQGDHVLAFVRNSDRGKQLLQHFQHNFKNKTGSIEPIICDLSSFESVVMACENIKLKYRVIDTIINNAGVWNFHFKESHNNIEETFHVNVLSHSLITQSLLGNLQQSNDAKIINTSSVYHFGKIHFEDIELRKKFNGLNAYRQSKLARILQTKKMAETHKDIGVYSFHPGVVSGNLGRDASSTFNKLFKFFGSSPKRGAQTLIYLVNQNKNKLKSGAYYCWKLRWPTFPFSNNKSVALQLDEVVEVYLEKNKTLETKLA